MAQDEGDKILISKFSFGSNTSGSSTQEFLIKKPQKRIPILKLEVKAPEKKIDTDPSHSLPIPSCDVSAHIDSSNHREVTLFEVLQKKTRKNSGAIEASPAANQKIADEIISKRSQE
jgi:hypothetical protein